jgi:hypothetical protein
MGPRHFAAHVILTAYKGFAECAPNFNLLPRRECL